VGLDAALDRFWENRIAQPLLHDGTYEGQRLVPGDYVARTTADTTPTGRAEPDTRPTGCTCGCALATGPGAWTGIYGQFGIALPEHHACVSVMAHYLGPTTRILDCVWGTHRVRTRVRSRTAR
jgi:CubicO group peptidase (beta-lactamase class C family)